MAHWIKEAIRRPGAFRAKAKAAGMGTGDYAQKVLAEGSRASARTRRQARLAQTLARLRNRVAEACPPSLGCFGETPGAAPVGAAWSGGLIPNTGWTDEARAASLAVRRAKAAARAKSGGGGEKKTEDGGGDSRGDAEERRAERDRIFQEQAKRAGEKFVEGWYPRGRDGRNQDPHYGETSPEAPYGYVEGTRTPRKEPLYDRFGRPIVPRSYEDYHRPADRGGRREGWRTEGLVFGMPVRVGGESLERDMEWMRKVEEAAKVWGPFGRKKRFMEANPGATEGEWVKHDREELEKWKKARGVDSRRSDGGAK